MRGVHEKSNYDKISVQIKNLCYSLLYFSLQCGRFLSYVVLEFSCIITSKMHSIVHTSFVTQPLFNIDSWLVFLFINIPVDLNNYNVCISHIRG